MMHLRARTLALCLVAVTVSATYADAVRDDIVASVASDTSAHAMLVRLCDDFGGRLTGTAANAGALDRLADELRELGLDPVREAFEMPGWHRGEDSVELLAPVNRPLRAAALAYSTPHRAFEADVVDLGLGRAEDYVGKAVEGRVGLIDFGSPLSAAEFAKLAAERGVRALLYLNRVAGGQLLARTGSFQGRPLAVPVYTVTQEEGRWLQRLCGRGQTPRVRMVTRSRPEQVETANLIVRFPGRSAETIIVGAHFDSWDLGQGAIDNGLGIAQLYALAKALRNHDLPRSVELIWFNGEELGLWGSRHQAERVGDRPIVAMINLDMVGVPIAVNALGDASLVPALERWHDARATPLSKGVQNENWFGSDHTPYQLAGVRAVTFNAPIDPDVVRYYHDTADTVDKVSVELVTASSAVIAEVLLALVHETELSAERRSEMDTRALFAAPALERRLRNSGLWRWR